MGLFSRMTTMFKAKMSRVLDQAENPHESLDYSYERQMEMLRNVKRGLVEVVSSKRRVEMQAAKLRQDAERLDGQARQAMAAEREDLARVALQRKQLALQQLDGLDEQVAGLEQEQEKLTIAQQRLSSKVEAFRVQKEVIKAQYSAAEAQVRIGEALSGVSEEMADVGMAADRAMQKTEAMKARAAAVDELTDTGVLENPLAPGDDLGRELKALSAEQNVEDELAAMRRQLGPGTQSRQLPEGQS